MIFAQLGTWVPIRILPCWIEVNASTTSRILMEIPWLWNRGRPGLITHSDESAKAIGTAQTQK
jgi:hypothetical protein